MWRRDKWWLILLLGIGLLFYGYYLVREPRLLVNFWFFEDAGYSFKIASNLAHGLGPSTDGVHATNGYQPLYVWLMVPLFQLLDKFTAMYAALAFSAACNIASGFLLYYFLARTLPSRFWPLLIFGVWMSNAAAIHSGTNGLETGLATFLALACFSWYWFQVRRDSPSYPVLAAQSLLFASAYLARIDNAVVIVAIALHWLWSKGRQALREWPQTATLWGPAGIIFGIYSIYNLAIFGHATPTSGIVVRETSHGSPLLETLWRATAILGNGVFSGQTAASGVTWWQADARREYLPWAVVGCVLLIVVALALAADKNPGFGMLYAILVVEVSLYVFYLRVSIFERYYHLPLAIGFVSLAFCGTKIDKFAGSQLPLWRCGFCLLLLSGLALGHYRTVSRQYSWVPGWWEGASWINTHLPEDAVIAGLQTGNSSFLVQRRVVNLDGVVNFSSFEANQQKRGLPYLEEQHVGYIADDGEWPFVAAEVANNPDIANRQKARMQLIHASPAYDYNVYAFLPRDFERVIPILSIVKKPGDGWELRRGLRFLSDQVLMNWRKGAAIEFLAKGDVVLRFLRHPWSGYVRVLREGRIVGEADLYSALVEAGWRLPLNATDGEWHVYRVEVTGRKNPASHGSEVWIDGLLTKNAASDVQPLGSFVSSDSIQLLGKSWATTTQNGQVYHHASRRGEAVRISFRGQALLIKSVRHDWSGIAGLWLDGKQLQTMDFFAANGHDAELLINAPGPITDHEVMLKIEGKNPSSRASELWIGPCRAVIVPDRVSTAASAVFLDS